MRLETVGGAADLIKKIIATHKISYVFIEKKKKKQLSFEQF